MVQYGMNTAFIQSVSEIIYMGQASTALELVLMASKGRGLLPGK